MSAQPRMSPLYPEPPVYSPPGPAMGAPAIPPGSKRSGLGVASLVLGICSLCLLWIPFALPVLGLLAVVLGAVQVNRVNRDPSAYGGKGMAVAGLVLGIIALVTTLMVVVFLAELLQDLERELRNVRVVLPSLRAG